MDDAATVARGTAPPRARKRTGPKLEATGPLAEAALELGISLATLAQQLGVPYGTVRTWNRRGRVLPEVAEKLTALRSTIDQRSDGDPATV